MVLLPFKLWGVGGGLDFTSSAKTDSNNGSTF